ncbi:PhoX family phosphatase [Accumulibacter sp.]|uniref:PhoX family protein n=1 Tax=Accumulibacter sp. TaxID=2053492 RepID=UPI002B8613A5|nr:PhoX family phosphatase [Accumulibacter sp.]HPU79632.1 PhoX family phosphatase [Accumulibacter sp.]
MPDDPISNDSTNPHFEQLRVASSTLSARRRRLLQLGFGSAALPFLDLPLRVAAGAQPGMRFPLLAASSEDRVRVPEGYHVQMLYAWGDPVSDAPGFRGDAGNSAAEQAEQAGMHHDGMHFFPFVRHGQPSSTHGLLCVNHEYTDEGLLHPDGMADWSPAKTLKSQHAHGVSVIEVELAGSARDLAWRVLRPSAYARRITARTPMRIDGPAAGAAAMRTRDDRRGNVVFGTLANCAMGVTPWGTYLSCEENFNACFNGLDQPTAAQKRYGLRARGAGMRWHEHDRRFDLASEPNEANRFGWVVEIDPWNPASVPVKHTALGRFKHEGAMLTLAGDRRVVVYMGDDEAFEYLYKYVSRDRFDAGKAVGGSLLAIGTLHVARFGADGRGHWIALQHGQNGLTEVNGFADQADILIRTRQAADLVGATKMDRPEWLAVHPGSGEVYCSLTNNRQRVDVDAANPRRGNVYGHIIRWREDGGDAAAGSFGWDLFVLGGDPQHADPEQRGNIRGDAFGSPDGLWFDRDGRLWIATDVSGSAMHRGDFARLGNNQLLVADVVSGEVRRFLTGPRGCEITGPTATPDGRNLFINVQHPGELPGGRSDPTRPLAGSGWPASQFANVTGGRPRSATIVVRRDDGGIVGA